MAEYSTSTGNLIRANPAGLSALYSNIRSLVTALNNSWGGDTSPGGYCAGWNVPYASSTPSYSAGQAIHYAPNAWYDELNSYNIEHYYLGGAQILPSIPTLAKGSFITNLSNIADLLAGNVACNYTACSYSVCYTCDYTPICGGCCES